MINDNQHADGSINHILRNDRNNEILVNEQEETICAFLAQATEIQPNYTFDMSHGCTKQQN